MSLSERQVGQSGLVMWFASLAFFRWSNILSGWDNRLGLIVKQKSRPATSKDLRHSTSVCKAETLGVNALASTELFIAVGGEINEKFGFGLNSIIARLRARFALLPFFVSCFQLSSS
ncbi:hypothetical protein Q3G72_017728 [Acer saccharum]|nr:hypothetical protein Q3G72_017728 [Acer saccharum]